MAESLKVWSDEVDGMRAEARAAVEAGMGTFSGLDVRSPNVSRAERVRLQRATEVNLGVTAALSLAELPPEWFDAAASCAEEADELESDANAARAEAAALLRHRRH